MCQSIQAVRTHELKAYIVYVKPPSLEHLRESRRTAFIATSYYGNRPFRVNGEQKLFSACFGIFG